MKEQILEIAEKLRLELITEYEAQNLLLCLFGVSVNEVEFCTCGNPSEEGTIRMVNDEDMQYFCCDCGKQVQD